jgi:hypothetical protein
MKNSLQRELLAPLPLSLAPLQELPAAFAPALSTCEQKIGGGMDPSQHCAGLIHSGHTVTQLTRAMGLSIGLLSAVCFWYHSRI